uniref:Uncharacterized protein n=1 Tax=Rhizophora mucronata TaxID=61149 RepID=A0A2P2PXI4_RHIMU
MGGAAWSTSSRRWWSRRGLWIAILEFAVMGTTNKIGSGGATTSKPLVSRIAFGSCANQSAPQVSLINLSLYDYK